MPILRVKQKQMQQKLAVKKLFLQGFSLLELLVVIGLLGVVAMAATTLIIDTGEEKRKDATEKNWDAIRKAIIGHTTQTLNGSPYLSGYVADMGRLPNNIKELITRTPDVDFDGDGVPDLTLPEQPEGQEIDLNTVDGASGTGVSGTLYGGWRGPYLYIAGSEYFRDGWGNESKFDSGAASETQFVPVVAAELATLATNDEKNEFISAVESAFNFGWNVAHSPALTAGGTSTTSNHCGEVFCEDMIVQSLGQGNLLGDIPNPKDHLDYSANYPKVNGVNIVNKNEWLVNSNISFDVLFNQTYNSASATGIELRIFHFEDDGIEDGTGTPANIPQDSVNGIAVGLSVTNIATYSIGTVSVSGTDLPLPIGRYAAIVVCDNGTSNFYLYDGDCSTNPTRTQPYYFVVMPSTRQVTIPWNTP